MGPTLATEIPLHLNLNPANYLKKLSFMFPAINVHEVQDCIMNLNITKPRLGFQQDY